MPGSTLTTAQNIGILTSFSYNDAIDNTNPVDYYKFSLTGTNNINLLLSGVTQSYLSAKIYYDKNNNGLIDSGEQLYSTNLAYANNNGQLTATLGAGTYYVGVEQSSNNANSNYSLQLSATSTPGSIASDPGSTFSTAYNIGNLTGTQTFKEFVGNVDPLDYYKFSLTGTNDINLVLSGLTQSYFSAKIYYDKNNNGLIDSGEQLYSTGIAGTNNNGQLTATLGAGTYYVGVEQYSDNANSNYSLQLSATSTPGSIASDPGSTFSTAYNIGNLTGTQTFKEFVGNVDPLDYYKFSLTGTNDINLVLSGLTQSYFSAKIYYDKNNNGLIDSGEQLYSTGIAGTNNNGQLTATLGAGTYYVGVEQYSDNANSNYSLQLSATSTPGSIASDPGSTFSTAYNIGNLTGTQTFKEFVGNVDPLDYYKFSLTGTNDINLVLSGLTDSYFSAKIYADKNNNGLIDSGEQLYYTGLAGTNSNGQLTATLGAGTYYVGVEQSSNNANSNYSLSLVNITNPNPNITLAVSPSSVLEDGTTNLIYTFTRAGSTTNALTVKYGVAGTATFNTDYTQSGAASFTGTTGTITFAAGSSTATLTINPTADTTFESDETVALTLATGTGYTIGTTTAVTSTITNDDPSFITINLSANQTIVEGLTNPQNAAYTVSLSQASSQTITVKYATANGTATAASDYTNTAGTLTFNPGETSKVINLPILNDAINEADETFTLKLTSPTNASLGTTNTITTTITDTLTASVTTTLPTNVENLTLTGTAVIDGTGNAGNNILKGNSANNTLTGGDGNDTYSFVANTALGTDTITETATSGIDTIDFTGSTSAVKVNLGVTTSQTVNSNLKLILSANNVIENATGGTGNDRLTGNALNNTLNGGSGNDQLQGLAGDDTLWGGLGDDILTGGTGKDKYLFQGSGAFSTALGVDYISQFDAGQDQIVLSKATFNAVTNTVGQALTDFAVVTDDEFVNASNARIVFSQGSGSLFYNQDGSVLGTDKVFEFARLGNPDITLSSSDFSLIA